jgi:uncharacterized repeat protein (TIGR01451 family)
MKKILLIFTVFLFTFSSIKSQDYRYIPDSNFRAFLISEGYPFDASGDSLDITVITIWGPYWLECDNRSISNLDGIQYFTSLYTLDCSHNNLTSLPELPSNLTSLTCCYNLLDSLPELPYYLGGLICNNNNLSKLPNLPINLDYLDCTSNNINILPPLPSIMWHLGCGYNQLDSLPALPPSLMTLTCDSNKLITIPTLPSSLQIIDCSNNRLSILPVLPDTLSDLYCRKNQIISLPFLPYNLRQLNCENNLLTDLPILPNKLSTLICSHNNISSIPPVTEELSFLECSNNPISCLPYLPSQLNILKYDSTLVNCLPNYPDLSILTTVSPPLGTHPLCNPFVHSCPSYTAIVGKIFIDTDMNCINDSIEEKVDVINLILSQDTITISNTTSAYYGQYSFNTLPQNIYTIHIDTTNIPFLVSCPISGFDTINIDSSHLFYSDRNFALQCKIGFDIGTTGLINTSAVRPATPTSFDLHAGDMASLYGVHCTNIAGKISVAYSGPIHYTGVGGGTLIPDSILPNRLVWNIADFSLLDFNEAIKPNFFVDTTALVGDLVCFTTEVTPSIGDRVLSNNTFSQCFDVRAAYDPNYKEVSPSGSVTASQDWMYYTIHFQNLGNSYAENIYVWDTIDTNLNLNTIQVVGSSHSQFMQVNNNNRSVLFNFQNIMLQDSTTNEPESHGWVQYRIKPNAGLAEGVQIHNTASILFDLNAPIVTNTVTNRICNTPSNITQSYTIAQGQSIRVGTHTYTTSGRYTDVLSNINGCDSLVTTTLQVVSSIAYENPLRILIYPNPANHQVLIQLEGVPTESVSIVDMYGRKVFESETISSKYIVNTEAWSNGTYIIQCGNKRGKLIVNH